MDRWNGKVALVTGASSGIGAAIAAELIKNGLRVVGVARRLERLETLKKETKDFSGEFYPLKGDVTKEEDINAAMHWVKSNLGTIHILVNNAGITRRVTLTGGDPNAWRSILNVNVMGLCIFTQKAFKLMKETGIDDGHIIHINSISGHYVPVGLETTVNMYPASKHAVTALTETLRQELRYLKSNIRVTSISPGYVDTEIVEASVEGTNEVISDESREKFKLLPSLQPKDIADAAIYVLSTPPHVQVHDLIIRPLGEPY